jgi:hypothetical protein
MYPNHVTLERAIKQRMEEDRKAAENTQFVHPDKIRLDLMIWQERIWDMLESLEAVREDLKRKDSSLQDSA